MLTLASHTIDETRVPERPVVLDVGCRNFDFTRAILAKWPGAKIVAMEPDPIVADPCVEGVQFCQRALVHDDRADAGYASYSTGEGNFLTDLTAYYDAKMIRVPCINIQKVMAFYDITHWDIVKLDCEGSEFDILQCWPGPIATQISVEFHDYSDKARWNDAFYAKLFGEKLPQYAVLQHALTTLGPGPAYGHWDSVLALK